MPEQFENGRKLDGKDSLQGFDAKEVCLYPKNLSVSFQKRLIMFCFHHFQVFTRCSFPNVPIRVPFSQSTVFKICRQKMCRFRVNRRPIRRIFHRFQNVPASCERSLRVLNNINISDTCTHLYRSQLPSILVRKNTFHSSDHKRLNYLLHRSMTVDNRRHTSSYHMLWYKDIIFNDRRVLK